MITSVNFFKSIKTYTANKFYKYIKPFKMNLPKLSLLKQDVFELKDGMPEVIMNNPPILEGDLKLIKDARFVTFGTEFRAYNYEGYDTKFPSRYVCIDSNGDRRLKPHLYIKYAEIKPEYARHGAYSSKIRELAELSKYDETEGRMILDARKVESPNMTKIPSPSLAHWKCGFRFVDKENNQTMKRVLNGEFPLEAAPEGTMYYSLV